MDVIEEIRLGNKDVVKQVYKENAKDIYNFAKTITGNHETALETTKRTFVVLFTNIRNGETPTNLRLSALKIAYDEACAIAMPSTEHVDSPYESSYKETAAAAAESRMSAAEPISNIPDEDAPLQVPISDEPDEDAPAVDMVPEMTVLEMSSQEVSDIEEVPDMEEASDIEEVPLTPYETYKVNAGIEEPLDRDTAPVQQKPRRKKKSAGFIVFLVVDIILAVILLWFIYGLLINLNIVPHFDLGYSLFDRVIYNLFWL